MQPVSFPSPVLFLEEHSCLGSWLYQACGCLLHARLLLQEAFGRAACPVKAVGQALRVLEALGAFLEQRLFQEYPLQAHRWLYHPGSPLWCERMLGSVVHRLARLPRRGHRVVLTTKAWLEAAELLYQAEVYVQAALALAWRPPVDFPAPGQHWRLMFGSRGVMVQARVWLAVEWRQAQRQSGRALSLELSPWSVLCNPAHHFTSWWEHEVYHRPLMIPMQLCGCP